MSSFLALMSAFISMATCLGNTDSNRRSWKRQEGEKKEEKLKGVNVCSRLIWIYFIDILYIYFISGSQRKVLKRTKKKKHLCVCVCSWLSYSREDSFGQFSILTCRCWLFIYTFMQTLTATYSHILTVCVRSWFNLLVGTFRRSLQTEREFWGSTFVSEFEWILSVNITVISQLGLDEV